MLDEETENLKIDNRKLRNRIGDLEHSGEKISEDYFRLLAIFRQLKKEKEQQNKDLKKAYYNFQRELQELKKQIPQPQEQNKEAVLCNN